MSERPDDSDLWKQVGRLLQRRPGWSFQAASSPGTPPAWCFVFGNERQLSVTVDGGSLSVYVVEADEEVPMSGTDELVEWLTTRWPGSLQEQREGVTDRLRTGRLFEWE